MRSCMSMWNSHQPPLPPLLLCWGQEQQDQWEPDKPKIHIVTFFKVNISSNCRKRFRPNIKNCLSVQFVLTSLCRAFEGVIFKHWQATSYFLFFNWSWSCELEWKTSHSVAFTPLFSDVYQPPLVHQNKVLNTCLNFKATLWSLGLLKNWTFIC